MNSDPVIQQVPSVILPEKQSLSINVVKAIVFCVLSASLVVGNFFLEDSFANEPSAAAEDKLISENVIIRFDPGVDSKLDNKLLDDKSGIFVFESGHLWSNFAISDIRANILVDRVVVMPNHASVDLSYDGEHLNLSVYGGDVYLGFLAEGINLDAPADPYSQIFMNRMLVPRGTQVDIAMKKITSDIEPLLYSKLSKEFKLSSIPEGKNDWIKSNQDKDLMFIEGRKQQYISDIIHNGVSVKDSLLSDVIFWAEENLTFVPEKKNTMIFEHLFNYLDAAIFYANSGDKEASDAAFVQFDTYYGSLPSLMTDGDYYNNRFDSYLNDLAVFRPNDVLYTIWESLVEKKFTAKKGVYDIVNDYWLDVYDAMDISDESAEQALDKYYKVFDKTIGDVKDEVFYKMYLTYQNQIFDNLLLRNSLFYKDVYFEMKNVFEQNLLELYLEGQLKEELKQLFISNKIDLMKRLRKFFFDGELDVVETQKIFDRLIAEVDDLMPQGNSGVAVVKLFQTQLDDIIDFWGYLDSPEYHTNAYGTNHRDRYAFYLKEREIVKSVDDLLQNVLGVDVEQKTVEDVKNDIEKTLMLNVDVSEVKLGKIDTPDQRYIKVNAVMGGYPFEAVYDRYQDSLKEVYVYGDLVSERSIKLGSLLELLQSEFADLADEVKKENGDEEITMETVAQRIARKNIADTLTEYGFVIDIEDVSVIDALNVSYRVEGVTIDGYADIKLTFDLVMSGEELVTNLFMNLNGKPHVFDGKYAIQDLVDMVIAEASFDVKLLEKDSETVDEPAVENSGKVER